MFVAGLTGACEFDGLILEYSISPGWSRYVRGDHAGTDAFSKSRCPLRAPRCSVSRPAASSRSPSGCRIRRSTARSSAPHRAGITDHLV